jgi:long-subunit acyl-CoA synthetase (AMP-forming)
MLFQGYWHNDAATAGMIDADGWLHTGDLGTLDDDGFLTITGRKEDLIITASGKNVAPAVLEERLRNHWLIADCLVVGDAKPFVAALVVGDEEAFGAGRPSTTGRRRRASRTCGMTSPCAPRSRRPSITPTWRCPGRRRSRSSRSSPRNSPSRAGS